MADFRKQIQEDILDYQKEFSTVENIEKDEWAFNFWILDKLYSVEEDLIPAQIVDYDDKGIDCFVWHEDSRDLYLIQNKYYSDNTVVSKSYILNDFLTRSIGALEKNSYTRSQELQDIYNKYHNDPDFCIYFNLYVTNNTSSSSTIQNALATFNSDNKDKHYVAKMFSLDDIQEAYFDEPIKETKTFSFPIPTINKGTILKINNEAYQLTQATDARYVLTPVLSIYNLYVAAKKEKYPIFDENIREYLGKGGNINKAIIDTLNSAEDRKNFFFYNNGITMIVSAIGSEVMKNNMRQFEVTNPQIVNGCQTVNSIYEALSRLPEKVLAESFKDSYVMLKILKIDPSKENLQTLYKNIVTYNNSQNGINEKHFVASNDVFKRVQMELEDKGFLLCIKQSDKNTFSEKYKLAHELLKLNTVFLNKYGIEERKKTKDFLVDLEKFLQVLLAFTTTPQNAIQNKAKLLKKDSEQYNTVTGFIKNPELTSNDYLNLYLLYLRAEKEKKKSDTGKIPNPFYLIYCVSKFECDGEPTAISNVLSDKQAIDVLIKKYTFLIMQYYTEWKELNPGKEYNDMIKAPIDHSLLIKAKATVDNFFSM